jgi:dTDP-4-amino-4,6-dideoxygalactose transaminase
LSGRPYATPTLWAAIAAPTSTSSTGGADSGELPYGIDDTPNYYNLVLTIDPDAETGPDTGTEAAAMAAALASVGLPPDSVRYRYRPLPHRNLFRPYQTPCPNAARLAAASFQLPAHPGMSKAALPFVAGRIAALATRK